MAEIYPIQEVLNQIEEFNPLQRILLATSGTLQSTLSAYFGESVTIEVVSQHVPRADAPGVIRRKIRLVCNSKPVCFAETTIYATDSEVIELINAQELGLGQIMQKQGIKPEFKLRRVGQDSSRFWRDYLLSGPQGSDLLDCGVTYHIREEFPQELYTWLV